MTKTLTEQQIKKIIENGTGKAAKVCEKKFYGKPKSLTGQMKTEHGAWYYVKTKEWGICHWLLFPDTLDFEKDIVEVLSAVPSYDEWKEISESEDQAHVHLQDEREKNMCLEESVRILGEKLSIATKALKKYMTFCRHPAEEALKEMEGVK